MLNLDQSLVIRHTKRQLMILNAVHVIVNITIKIVVMLMPYKLIQIQQVAIHLKNRIDKKLSKSLESFLLCENKSNKVIIKFI